MDVRRGRLLTSKTFRVDPVLLNRFEAVCRIKGLSEYEVVDEFLRDFLEKNWDQTQLDRYMGENQPIFIHADRVNIVARKANVLIVKQHLEQLLGIMSNLGAHARTHPGEDVNWKPLQDDLFKTLREAAKLPPEARDEELQTLVAQAEKWFTQNGQA